MKLRPDQLTQGDQVLIGAAWLKVDEVSRDGTTARGTAVVVLDQPTYEAVPSDDTESWAEVVPLPTRTTTKKEDKP